METKLHWERIYTSKKSEEFSWTQDTPATSISFLKEFNVPKSAPIIDIGGGESKLVDYLLNEGYTDVTVLDISEKALERAKTRLGDNSLKVNWIVSDITDFVPTRQYAIWHDRATFHFLTEESQIEKYVSIASGNLTGDGFMTIGTFSENGPDKCSGLQIKKYSEDVLTSVLQKAFEKLKCIKEDHVTPFQTVQNFLFCSFQKKNAVLR
ncbi:MAG TPA: class I SAM-dependent methyltransferase [Chryseosolibacter sp.]